MRSLQPPDSLWIHWSIYNSIANTSKWVLFLPPSDVYVKNFLYPFYTLINSIAQKLWGIKPCPWPGIELFSRGQESQHLFVGSATTFHHPTLLQLAEHTLPMPPPISLGWGVVRAKENNVFCLFFHFFIEITEEFSAQESVEAPKEEKYIYFSVYVGMAGRD